MRNSLAIVQSPILISYPKYLNASSTLGSMIIYSHFLHSALFNLPIVNFIRPNLLYYASTVTCSSLIIKSKFLLLFLLTSLPLLILLIIKYFSNDFHLILVSMGLLCLSSNLTYSIVLNLWQLVLNLPLHPLWTLAFRKVLYLVLFSSAFTQLHSATSFPILLYPTIFTLMIHSSIFHFLVQTRPKIFLCFPLLSIQYTPGLLAIACLLIHQKLNIFLSALLNNAPSSLFILLFSVAILLILPTAVAILELNLIATFPSKTYF